MSEIPEMVERVAKAMHDAVSLTGMPWNPSDTANKGYYDAQYKSALAAIEAMRGPTEPMILAGVHHDNMGDMAGRWNAMLDAALSPASNGEK